MISRVRQVLDPGGRGSEQPHGVGAELPVLFGSPVRPRGAAVQTEHELKVLVGLLLVSERPVVRAFVLALTPTAPLVSRGRTSFPRGRCAREEEEEDEVAQPHGRS